MFFIRGDLACEYVIDLVKAGGHKYVRRTGSPGSYRYWYKMPDGSIQAQDHMQGAGKIEHVKRLLIARMQGSHSMSNEDISKETGHHVDKVRSIQSNLRTGVRKNGSLIHDHSSDELREHEKVGQVIGEEGGRHVAGSGDRPADARHRPLPAGSENRLSYRGKLSRMTRPQLHEEARKLGVNPAGFGSHSDLASHLATKKYEPGRARRAEQAGSAVAARQPAATSPARVDTTETKPAATSPARVDTAETKAKLGALRIPGARADGAVETRVHPDGTVVHEHFFDGDRGGGTGLYRPRRGEEDDDHPDFVGYNKVKKLAHQHFGADESGVSDRHSGAEISVRNHEKGLFSVTVTHPAKTRVEASKLRGRGFSSFDAEGRLSTAHEPTSHHQKHVHNSHNPSRGQLHDLKKIDGKYHLKVMKYDHRLRKRGETVHESTHPDLSSALKESDKHEEAHKRDADESSRRG